MPWIPSPRASYKTLWTRQLLAVRLSPSRIGKKSLSTPHLIILFLIPLRPCSLSTIRDADQIYVVGAGQIIEHGTHNELLSNDTGAYAQLVSAQKLKGRDKPADDEGGKKAGELMTAEEVQEALQEEKPELERQRTGSGRSLASEALDKKKKGLAGQQFGEVDHGMVYLARRMVEINREDATLYFGGIAGAIGECRARLASQSKKVLTMFPPGVCLASGMVYPAFGIVFGQAISSFSLQDRHALRTAGDRNALWYVERGRHVDDRC